MRACVREHTTACDFMRRGRFVCTPAPPHRIRCFTTRAPHAAHRTPHHSCVVMRARVLCVRTTLGAGVGALSVRRVPRTLAACLTPLVNVFARAFAVLAAVGISLQVVLHGFIHVGGARRKVRRLLARASALRTHA
ncbi:hypothetical protein EON67_09700, partial [archaeon]